ncbi:MAG TPA: YkgJ family cysteine cluster protein [Saprospiraceae bacterium]|nr:YkgJ family cysteine cluster protein [Saprospiraceae bacterium]
MKSISFTLKVMKEWKDESATTISNLKTFLIRLKKDKYMNESHEALQRIHHEVFSAFDCMQCAGCCKTTPPLYTLADIKRISKSMNMSPSMFKRKYTISDINGDLTGITVPCPFLMENNACQIYNIRPEACRNYPHTDDPLFTSRPELNLKNIKICPAAFQIVKRLEQSYQNN